MRDFESENSFDLEEGSELNLRKLLDDMFDPLEGNMMLVLSRRVDDEEGPPPRKPWFSSESMSMRYQSYQTSEDLME